MNAITPANEMPPLQSTAASGMLPIEQTNASAATSGPDDHVLGDAHRREASVRNSRLKTSIGSVEMYPAITKPPAISFHSICQSPRKLCATSDHACIETSLRRNGSRSAAHRRVKVTGGRRLSVQAYLFFALARHEPAERQPHQADQDDPADDR